MTEIDPFSADIIKHRADEFHKKQAMTPTQAQIEAAAQAIFEQRFERDWRVWNCMDDAKAALTAAAEAGEQKAVKLGSWEQKIVDATIERCAQIVEKYYVRDVTEQLAAKIRAMKDQYNVR